MSLISQLKKRTTRLRISVLLKWGEIEIENEYSSTAMPKSYLKLPSCESIFCICIYLYMYVHVIRKLYIAHRRWLKSLFKFPALLEYQVQGRLKCC